MKLPLVSSIDNQETRSLPRSKSKWVILRSILGIAPILSAPVAVYSLVDSPPGVVIEQEDCKEPQLPDLNIEKVTSDFIRQEICALLPFFEDVDRVRVDNAACGRASVGFCDGTLALNPATLSDLPLPSNRKNALGIAVLTTTAHELAHNQDANTGQSGNDELRADCVAGAVLEQAGLGLPDLQTASLFLGGLAENSSENPGTHGSYEQRVAAFSVGATSARAEECMLVYPQTN